MSTLETLSSNIILSPEDRVFPSFSLSNLLTTVFDPISGSNICILTDFEDPKTEMLNFQFLKNQKKYPVQYKAYHEFFSALKDSVIDELEMKGGEMFAYHSTGGSNLDMQDECFDVKGNQLSLDRDIYSQYDIILCISDWSATAPLTAKCKEFNFRGATMHGVNDIILSTGLAVDYEQVSADAEKLRIAMTRADDIEIDFTIDDGRVLTAKFCLLYTSDAADE